MVLLTKYWPQPASVPGHKAVLSMRPRGVPVLHPHPLDADVSEKEEGP